MASDMEWRPIEEPLDFSDSVYGLVAQIKADEIRTELNNGKQYTITFSTDEPLIRVCEFVPAAPVVPVEVRETIERALDYYLKCEARLEYVNGKIIYESDAFYQRIKTARTWLAGLNGGDNANG